MESTAKIVEVWIYPVKGLKGFRIERAFVERRGLVRDRRWMVVGNDLKFISQRQFPGMARITATLAQSELVLTKGERCFEAPLVAEGERVRVQIWRDEVDALAVSAAADQWLSEELGQPCRLVQMPDSTVRPTHPEFSNLGDHVSFADGFPLLLTSMESLCDLNQQLDIPIPMTRFRPNLVATGFSAWEEERNPSLEIGAVTFDYAKPCGRCAVTTVDQATGLPTGQEPLRTLAKYRGVANFGANLVPQSEGWVCVGDSIRIGLQKPTETEFRASNALSL